MRPHHKLDAWVKSDAEGTRYFTAEGAEEEERGKTRDCFVLISSALLAFSAVNGEKAGGR